MAPRVSLTIALCPTPTQVAVPIDCQKRRLSNRIDEENTSDSKSI